MKKSNEYKIFYEWMIKQPRELHKQGSSAVVKAFIKTRKVNNPTLEEVKSFFKEKGYNEKIANEAFNYYEEGDWVDGRGNKVINWKQKMRIWFKDEHKINIKKTKKNNFIDGNIYN